MKGLKIQQSSNKANWTTKAKKGKKDIAQISKKAQVYTIYDENISIFLCAEEKRIIQRKFTKKNI